MKSFTSSHPQSSDADLMLAVERAKRRNRARVDKRDRWERDLWSAYVLDGPARLGPAANDPPTEIA